MYTEWVDILWALIAFEFLFGMLPRMYVNNQNWLKLKYIINSIHNYMPRNWSVTVHIVFYTNNNVYVCTVAQ